MRTMISIKDAVSEIDEVLGQGYAEANPELLAAVLQRFSIAFVGDAVDAVAIAINENLGPKLAESLDNLATVHEYHAERVAAIAEQIRFVSESLDKINETFETQFTDCLTEIADAIDPSLVQGSERRKNGGDVVVED
jgi:hypothetical protein